jgi:hypothetical protein
MVGRPGSYMPISEAKSGEKIVLATVSLYGYLDIDAIQLNIIRRVPIPVVCHHQFLAQCFAADLLAVR